MSYDNLHAKLHIFSHCIVICVYDSTTGKLIGDGPTFSGKNDLIEAESWCDSQQSITTFEYLNEEISFEGYNE